MTSQLSNIAPIHLNVPINNNYTTKLLTGLGKPTKRGIKKCSKCGNYNGTRSTICKNKQCGTLLKDSEDDKHKELDAVKIITGTVRQVYSVRVRDMGPDYRGFVQLPLLHSQKHDETNLFSEVALCFVNSCQRLFDDSILKCHEEEQTCTTPFCCHINAALKSCTTATPINFKNEILNNLQVSDEFKNRLLLLDTETEGPLVQRVSKSVMAVKCQVTSKQPLGYLHFSFRRGKGKEVYEKYSCSCTEVVVGKSNYFNNKCIHYYACVCALASDNQYLDEFLNFISTALPTTRDIPINPVAKATNSSNNKTKESNKRKFLLIKRKKTEQKLKKSQKSYKLSSVKKLIPKIFPVEIKVINSNNEPNAVWHFLDWLSSVTDSINQTMKFENCGVINTLIFHIPENFYGCFKTRIPVVYCSDQRSVNDAAAYYIMNILHLKEIFDTHVVKLRISKKFIQTEQNCYMEYDENDEHIDITYKSTFIFFLNVGQSTVDESDNTNNSFIIEWLPNISNLTGIGQLKLQYKYGRKST